MAESRQARRFAERRREREIAAEKNASVTEEFRRVILRYGRILPSPLTPADNACKDYPMAAHLKDPAERRVTDILAVACGHLKEGRGQEAMHVLDDAASLLRHGDEGDDDLHARGRDWLRHLRLKAMAAQGLLPFLRGDAALKFPPNLPALWVCMLDMVYKTGARRLALQACEPVLVIANTVYMMPVLKEEWREELNHFFEDTGKEVARLTRDALDGRTEGQRYFFEDLEMDGPFDPAAGVAP